MSLHYLDPEREPRECPRCDGLGSVYRPKSRRNLKPEDYLQCLDCAGTGRLGVEGAEPDVEVRDFTPMGSSADVFYWRTVAGGSRTFDELDLCGPHPTEALALTAARAAHKGEKRG